MEPLFEKGHVFHGPDEQGYILTRDVFTGDLLKNTDVLPFGGAPEPVAGEVIIEWLAKQIIKVNKNI